MNTPQINELIQKQIASTALGPKKFEDYIWKCNAEGGEPMSDLIDRQAAIKAIEDLPNCYNGFSDTYDKSCIIGVLEELPSAQPGRRFDEWCTDCKEYDQEKHCCPRWNRVIRTTLQEVQAERKRGKWKIKTINTFEMAYGSTGYEPVYECSVCGRVEESYLRFDEPIMPEDADFPNFCPNCGARMEAQE